MELSPQPSPYARRLLDAARAGILVAAAAIPFSTALMNVAVVAAFVCWLLSGQWRPAAAAIAALPPAWIGCVLFGAMWVGVAWTSVPFADAAEVAMKYRELVLFGIVVFLFADERWRRRLLWTLFIAGIALLVASFAVQLDLLPRGKLANQSAVLKKSSITHSFMVSLFAYAAALLAIELRGWQRWAMAAAALIGVFNIFAAVQGRIGYLVTAVLAVWLAARWSAKGVLIAMAAGAAVLVAAWQWAPAFQEQVALTLREANELDNPRRNSIAKRLHWTRRSAEITLEHPLLGVGTGGWRPAFREAAVEDHPIFRHPRRNWHPHNEYAHVAVQIGLGGLALLVALFASAFVCARRLPGFYSPLAQGLVIAFAVGCLFNDFLLDATEGHLWAILGGGLFAAWSSRSSAARYASGEYAASTS